jgi:hypothetical protein
MGRWCGDEAPAGYFTLNYCSPPHKKKIRLNVRLCVYANQYESTTIDNELANIYSE